MKRWNAFSKQERIMVIVILVLLVLILLTNSRVRSGFKKGIDFFYSTETELPASSEPKTN